MDKFYASAASVLDYPALIKAGYIPHEKNLDFKDFDFCNLSKINYSNSRENWVIISTGAFHPVHLGHIQLLENTKLFVETNLKGHVAGGFLSPSSKAYLDIKLGNKCVADNVRKFIINKQLSRSSWIAADFWELNQEAPINFTEVMCYFEEVLNKNLNTSKAPKIIYAFGADNAEFCDAFVRQGYCACVLRPGFEAKFKEYKEKYANSGRHFFVESNSMNMSSTVLGHKMEIAYKQGDYFVRDDSFLAYASQRPFNIELFKLDFLSLLREVLSSNCTVHLVDCAPQLDLVKHLTANGPCLNLDIVTSKATNLEKSYNVGVSRLFNKNDNQISPIKLISRIEDTLSLEERLSKIPKGEYCFIDDDIASGRTLAEFKEISESHGLKITNAISLLQETTVSNNLMDVIDLRDFLPRCPWAGLVVQNFDGSINRVPYVDDFVCLYSRASIPFEAHTYFRKAVKLLYAKYDLNVNS